MPLFVFFIIFIYPFVIHMQYQKEEEHPNLSSHSLVKKNPYALYYDSRKTWNLFHKEELLLGKCKEVWKYLGFQTDARSWVITRDTDRHIGTERVIVGDPRGGLWRKCYESMVWLFGMTHCYESLLWVNGMSHWYDSMVMTLIMTHFWFLLYSCLAHILYRVLSIKDALSSLSLSLSFFSL